MRGGRRGSGLSRPGEKLIRHVVKATGPTMDRRKDDRISIDRNDPSGPFPLWGLSLMNFRLAILCDSARITFQWDDNQETLLSIGIGRPSVDRIGLSPA
jgi:hypothetical protein